MSVAERKSNHLAKKERVKRAKLNISMSLLMQGINVICGLIVPRLMLKAFGSDAYGATASITQFLSYIVLLEGGIGGVARSALYAPLAHKNWHEVSRIMAEVRYFFRVIGGIFIVYTLVLACIFKSISHFQYYDWIGTFALVIIISLSSIAQYLLGISNTILLSSSQREYINKIIDMGALIANTLLVVILIWLHCNLLVVKLASSLVFILRPVAMYLYVYKYFPLDSSAKRDKDALKQKWTGLGQHLAYFIHHNTDIAILTLFANLSLVSVYSIYHMISNQMQSLTSSFTSGMEAIFGEMLAKKEIDALRRTFSYYETLISCISVSCFATAAILIVPFVSIYTRGITDANYIQNNFALLLILSALLFSLRTPYHSLVMSAGHFKQTRWAAYGEAILNIFISVLLVYHYGLVGVAIGTLCAVSFRFIFYTFHTSSYLLVSSPVPSFKRLVLNLCTFSLILCMSKVLWGSFNVHTYWQWILVAVPTFIGATIICLILNISFYPMDMRAICKQIKRGR